MPALRQLQDTLSQLSFRFESNFDQLSSQLTDPDLRLEVIQYWGQPQTFIEAFSQNHTQLMEFICHLHKQPSPSGVNSQKSSRKTIPTQDDAYLQNLESAIFKQLQIKEGRNDLSSQQSLDSLKQDSLQEKHTQSA